MLLEIFYDFKLALYIAFSLAFKRRIRGSKKHCIFAQGNRLKKCSGNFWKMYQNRLKIEK